MQIKTNPSLHRMIRRACAVCLTVPLLATAFLTPIAALEPNGTGLVVRNWLINNPDYTFSEAYKTSVWYENFSALSLSDNHRNNVLRIAMSQLGYHEGNSPSDFDGENLSGNQNYIEYARLLTPWYNNNSYEWCACFVNWCLNQADIDYVYGEISCLSWVNWLKNNGQFEHAKAYGGTYTPRPADFIFFSWDSVNTTSNHIGFVLYTTKTEVYTIEGNTSDCVGIRSYKLNDTRIIGYGTPNYRTGTERDISYTPGTYYLPGSYIANGKTVSYVRLYDHADASTYTNIPNGAMVTLNHRIPRTDSFIPVQYGDLTGYIDVSGTNTLSLLTPATYSFSYDANGGEGEPSAVYDFCYTEQAISKQIPTKENAIFLGWAYDTNATEAPLLQADDPLTLTQANTILYAVWEDIPVEAETESEADTAPPPEESDSDTEASGEVNSDTTPPVQAETDSDLPEALWETLYTDTTVIPENLTTITGGAPLQGTTGCGAVIASISSVILPISLMAALAWRRRRDHNSRNEDNRTDI